MRTHKQITMTLEQAVTILIEKRNNLIEPTENTLRHAKLVLNTYSYDREWVQNDHGYWDLKYFKNKSNFILYDD